MHRLINQYQTKKKTLKTDGDGEHEQRLVVEQAEKLILVATAASTWTASNYVSQARSLHLFLSVELVVAAVVAVAAVRREHVCRTTA